MKYNINYKEIVKQINKIENIKVKDKMITVNNEFYFEYSDKRIAKAIFEKLKNFINI